MGMTKKTMILSNDQFDHKSMLTLTLEKKGKEWVGILKSYYFEDKQAEYLLGIACQDKQMCIVPVCFQGGSMAVIRTVANLDLQKKITCVLVTKEDKKPIVWGSTEKLDDTRMNLLQSMQQKEKEQPVEDRVVEIKNSVDQEEKDHRKDSSILSQASVVDDQISQGKQDTLEDVDRIVTDVTNIQDTVDPTALFQPLEEKELDQVIDQAMSQEGKLDMFAQEMAKLDHDQDTFYDQIKDQIEDLFAHNEHERNLESLVPHSQWVLVDQVDGSGQYVLGLLYEDQTLRYIAYGVQGEKDMLPPEEFRAYSQFILTSNGEEDQGYWVMYQDALTGDNCMIEDHVA